MNATKIPGSTCTAISVELEAANYKANHVSLLGISLSSKPRSLQLLVCASAFFFGYTINGICEEYVYNRLQFSFGWYFTFIQSFIYLGLLTWLQGFRLKHMVNPWATYWKLSAVLMGSHGLTKGSLAYLNYPAQIMFKSTKVLPVMIMGTFVPGLRRKYELHDYFSALLLVSGLIVFTLADAHMSPNFNVVGVLMICGALVLDAFMGNLQEAIFTTNPATSQVEMLFCSTAAGLPFLLVPMILTGELFSAWTACSQHAYVYVVLVLEAMATFIGQLSVLSLVALFGAATTAMVTTGRKALTLLISYLMFTKPFSEQHLTGLLLIAMGIAWKMMLSDHHRPAAAVLTADPDDHNDHDHDRDDDDRRRLIDPHCSTKCRSMLPITRSINHASDQRDATMIRWCRSWDQLHQLLQKMISWTESGIISTNYRFRQAFSPRREVTIA